jgi:ferric iron reductase protein FhuF
MCAHFVYLGWYITTIYTKLVKRSVESVIDFLLVLEEVSLRVTWPGRRLLRIVNRCVNIPRPVDEISQCCTIFIFVSLN